MDIETQALVKQAIKEMQALTASFRADTVLSKIRAQDGSISGVVRVDARDLALAVVALAETGDIDLTLKLLAEAIATPIV
jgi:hypothetical protein